MILKYNISSQLTDSQTDDLRWLVPKTIALNVNNTYQINSTAISKGDPFTLTIGPNPINIVRYLIINSEQSFTISINNGPEYLTQLFVLDVGLYREGFTNLSKINSIKITNPTGTSGLVGSQFSNPATIEVKYLLVLENV
jgi:hypothetical protein